MRRRNRHRCLCWIAGFILWSCGVGESGGAAPTTTARTVDSRSFDLDAKNPERKQFGALTFMGAFQLNSKHKRFGGLSGLSIGADGKLYAVSDRGYWISARMIQNTEGALEDLVDWQISPVLAPAKIPVTGSLADASPGRGPDR